MSARQVTDLALEPLAPLTPQQRQACILDACRTLGFAHAGVCAADASAYGDVVRAWVDDGKHGEMSYIGDRVEQMLDPNSVLDGVRSIICVADRYSGARDSRDQKSPAHGRIGRYARGRDYHDVIRRRLKKLAEAIERASDEGHGHRAVVDTAPLMEREHAVRAGLGLIGKHTLLIRPAEGSWLLLGEVLTTLEIAPSEPMQTLDRADPCGSCTRCIDACPTDAIRPFSVDASRCLSYTTIEHRGPIDPSLYESTGDWLFGCDVCQEVCPHNQPTRRTRRLPVHDAYAPRRTGFDLLEVLGWTEEDRRAACTTSALKRAKLPMFKRNALICAGNALRQHDDPALRAGVAALAEDASEDSLVRETAREVLARVSS